MRRTSVECVGAVVSDSAGRLLMIRRGKEPDLGCWSIPGGHIEPGESDEEATAREVLEETGLRVTVGDLVGSIEREAPGGVLLVIRDYRCTLTDGIDGSAVRAGDDAEDVGWFTHDAVRDLTCATGLVETLEAWGVLSSSSAG